MLIQNKVIIFIDGIPQWNRAAVVFTLRCSLEHSTSYLFGKLSTEPLADSLKHTFCDDAGAICGNVLFGRYNSYSVVSKYLLVVTGIILVASKAIQLVYKYDFKVAKFAVSDHTQKFRSPVGLRTLRPVDIFLHDKKIIGSRIALAFFDLSFDGHFILFI